MALRDISPKKEELLPPEVSLAVEPWDKNLEVKWEENEIS